MYANRQAGIITVILTDWNAEKRNMRLKCKEIGWQRKSRVNFMANIIGGNNFRTQNHILILNFNIFNSLQKNISPDNNKQYLKFVIFIFCV